ncbi:peptidyl-prolyl cis-trans isomerase SurA [Tangfeifania diversioriginum]|uniref:Peptidyl-prolyl cis-trans isomerase SurA n=1 Tax=Tangfeifania diversioriginum TaxID=1168035 RepID=A0A1M6J7B2_9BACT|nr:peptidylprolyl isomerase [Tangfeifania diversioriginum]SHJ42603.1 peptidyl-prolyl cis-trans isomerase SurA [Tangfeifania diversioriginum]
MKHTVFLIAGLILFSGLVWGQNEEILLTIDDIEISKAEFERIYRKNNQNLYDETEAKSPKEYLDMFIDYKLKVIEAQNLKMDTSTAFKTELAGYRKELAAPYLTDMKYDEKLIKELYNRMTKEINASHILLQVPENATYQKEQEVLKKANEIRAEILAGKPFSEAAVEYSEDPNAANNGGQLGYFTAFQMVAPFENAAFNTPVGEISEPVRSSFGYHLIKVHDLRPNKGEIKVAHIMKMFPQGVENFDKNELKKEIDSIYTELQNGADFADMARKLSDDKRSAMQGGEMPWFSAGRMIPEFSTPAFALENTGDMTPPVETPFGFHIIKKLDHRPVPSFEEAREQIEERVRRDPERSNSSQKAFVEKLKKEYNFEANSANLEKLKTNENPSEELLLFSIDNKDFHLNDFNAFLKKNGIENSNSLGHYNDWVAHEIIQLEDSKLEEKHPEFRYLMKEYHDGILLFNIMEEKIWGFASKDTAGLQKFYKKNKGIHQWGERFKGLIITCKSQETRQEAEKYFAAGMTAAEVEDLLNESGKKVEIEEGAWEEGANDVVDYYVWNGKKTTSFNPELTFIRGDKIPPEPKTLEEARGLYISDYQNHLEKEWLKKLRKKYKIKVNKKVLRSVPHV